MADSPVIEVEKTVEYRVRCATCKWQSMATPRLREAKRWVEIHAIFEHGQSVKP